MSVDSEATQSVDYEAAETQSTVSVVSKGGERTETETEEVGFVSRPPAGEDHGCVTDNGQDAGKVVFSDPDSGSGAWRWEYQWVEVDRSIGTEPLRLRKWVRVPCEDRGPARPRTLTVETGKDGTQILVGGFMEYHCPHPGCRKVFTSAGSLRKHMHIHGEKQFICNVPGCNKRFIDKSKLKRHLTTHTSDPKAQRNKEATSGAV